MLKKITFNLNKIKVPSEFSRTQRSFDEIKFFKANEYRNFIYYTGFFGLNDVLHEDYFKHFVTYILFVRILTQETLSDNDLSNATKLITYFYSKFSILYGEENLNYKLHGHIHLVEQCRRHGSLNKITGFPFEGRIKTSRANAHGTRGYLSQMHKHSQLKQIIDSNLDEILANTEDFRVKSFMVSLLDKDKRKCVPKAIDKINANRLEDMEKNLLLSFNLDLHNISIMNKLIHKNLGNNHFNNNFYRKNFYFIFFMF